MAVFIIPRLARGRPFFRVGDVYSPTFAQAASAWPSAFTSRLGDIEEVHT